MKSIAIVQLVLGLWTLTDCPGQSRAVPLTSSSSDIAPVHDGSSVEELISASMAAATTEESANNRADGELRRVGRQGALSETDRRRLLAALRFILTDVDSSVNKRTCRLNLGGHCATENAVAVADNWHFLNSAQSPGRRRR